MKSRLPLSDPRFAGKKRRVDKKLKCVTNSTVNM